MQMAIPAFLELTVKWGKQHKGSHSVKFKLNLNRVVGVSWAGREKGREECFKKANSISGGKGRAWYIQG